jgi:hypothetical protein
MINALADCDYGRGAGATNIEWFASSHIALADSDKGPFDGIGSATTAVTTTAVTTAAATGVMRAILRKILLLSPTTFSDRHSRLASDCRRTHVRQRIGKLEPNR